MWCDNVALPWIKIYTICLHVLGAGRTNTKMGRKARAALEKGLPQKGRIQVSDSSNKFRDWVSVHDQTQGT
jgi:hypothetical protein